MPLFTIAVDYARLLKISLIIERSDEPEISQSCIYMSKVLLHRSHGIDT